MPGLPATAILFATSFIIPAVRAYQWPEPQYDALEELLYEPGLSQFTDGGQLRNGNSGSSISAQWVRFAYHDSATHNIDDGTGGLDGSIFFELNSPENVGQGMSDTLFTFLSVSNKLVSRADVTALGVVHSVVGQGGPLIPFRGGRIDATKAGPAGVPTPHQDIQSHLESFRRQGFNQTEMIGLVACGHTLGAVRSRDFPEIVPAVQNDSLPSGRMEFFDLGAPADGGRVQDIFDEKIASGYIDGTTKNPLVVGPNVETRSDLRIFSSDQNVTTKSLVNPAVFQTTCRTLLQRMIDTVPKDVKLSDQILPLSAKILDHRLIFLNNSLHFLTSLRLSNRLHTDGGTVRACWLDRANSDCSTRTGGPTGQCADAGRQAPVPVSKYASQQGLNFTRFDFLAPVNATSSISEFWFEISSKNRRIVLKNRGGKNFDFGEDGVIFAKTLSLSSEAPNPRRFNFVVGVKQDLTVSRSVLTVSDDDMIPAPPQVDEPFELQPTDSPAPMLGYTFFKGLVQTKGDRPTLDIHVELSDGRKLDILNQNNKVGIEGLPPVSSVAKL